MPQYAIPLRTTLDALLATKLTVPPGGTTGQALVKQADGSYAPATISGGSSAVSSVAGRTGAVTLTKNDVALNNVDNVADALKPVSTAQAAADSAVQAAAVQRSNHTGTQAVSTVTGLQTLLDAKAQKSLFNITDPAYGASTGVADNATAIQAAINAAAVTGGIVFIPQGTFTTSPLVMRTRVSLHGVGASSVLFLKSGSNTHFLTLYDANTEQVGLVDLTIDGNKANQTAGEGLHFDNTGFTTGRGLPSMGDPMHYLHRVNIQNCKSHGWKGIGDVSHTKMDQVWAFGNGGNSFYFGSPDNQLVNCVSANSGLEGFYLASNSNRLVDCKAWTAGALLDMAHASGYAIAGCDRIDFIGCEAQDNRNHGFVLVNTTQLTMSGCRANRNGLGVESGGVSPGGGGDGMYLQGVTNSRIDVVAYDHNNGGLKQRWGYNCGTNNDGNIVTIAIGQQQDATQPGVGSFGPGSLVTMTFLGKPVPQSQAPIVSTVQTGTTYTLTLADMGTEIETSNASAVTLTLPGDAAVAFPIGTEITVWQTGAGQVTFAAGTSVTLKSRGNLVKIAGQDGAVTIRKSAANTWRLAGDLA